MAGQGPRVGFEYFWNPNPSVVANAFFTGAEKARALQGPLEEVVARLAQEFADNFAAEGRPAWAPLAASTIAKRGSDHPILQDTGELEAAAADPGSWSIEGYGQTWFASWNGPDYSGYHLTGTSRMPARPWDFYSDEVDTFMDQVFSDYIFAPLL